VDLIARDAERAAATRSVRFGAGAVIAGEAGVGKTALAAAVADTAAAQGVPVLRVLATAASRAIPFAALGPLLPTDSGEFHPAIVPGLVLRTLSELGGRQRPLLLVDDAQLLDDHSAVALLGVIHRGGARALVTVRLGGRPSDAVTALWKDGLLDRIDLQPLDAAGARSLLRGRLGGEVAAVTSALLWRHSQGNPLYLTELARFGVATGRLTNISGVWWWSGAADVPPRLAELLEHRLEDVTAAAAEARDVLALGESLPYDTVAAVVQPDAIWELDEKGILASDVSAGVVRLRFSHPLLFAVAARRLSAARRRTLAARLVRAPAEHVDLLRLADWQEAAGGRPDVQLLERAARSLIVVDPTTAVRFAERAVHHDEGPSSAVTLADAQAELGRIDDAAASLDIARSKVRTDQDRLVVGISEASLKLWSQRQPGAAIEVMKRLDGVLQGEPALEARAAGALLTLFSARPALAGELAEAVIADGPNPDGRRRCLMVRLAAATLGDRPDEAHRAAADLADVLTKYPQPASARSLSTVIAATSELFGQRSGELPRAGGGTGRWPMPQNSMTIPTADAGVSAEDAGLAAATGPTWPLLDGVRHHLAGNVAAAASALREATVQQLQGEGLFRSEATGGLVVVLVELGELEEARKALADNGPDEVALIPGMRGWAQAWLLHGSGRSAGAAEVLLQTARESAEVGAVTSAFWHLADAARMGAAAAAAELAEEWAGLVGSDLTAARMAGIRARSAGRGEPLVAAAELNVAAGLFGHALELAELGARWSARSSARGAGGIAARAAAVAATARASLGLAPPAGSAELPEQLTRREAEIARLAAQGMRDKDIADELVLSVRTVESHLATAYRKLRIASRRELVDALNATPGLL